MVKKFLTIMFASVMAMLAFTAYSNDDEPPVWRKNVGEYRQDNSRPS